jgi:hypothetical protein
MHEWLQRRREAWDFWVRHQDRPLREAEWWMRLRAWPGNRRYQRRQQAAYERERRRMWTEHDRRHR